jgi:hypothetical protein
MVVAELTTSCQPNEKLKKGPINNQNMIKKIFIINIQCEPNNLAAELENFLNQSLFII